MQQAQASLSASSFASMLTALASPTNEPAQTWDDDALADDIATISYEKALRTHSRIRSLASNDPTRQQTNLPSVFDAPAGPSPQQNRKAASITIRISQAECAQLRQRAADAGISVSAYLRSCLFEAETLRAQVREALSQFRSASPTNSEVSADPAAHSATWRSKLFPGWSRSHRNTSA